MSLARSLVVASIAVLVPQVVSAQVIQPPPRVYRGLFGASANDPNRWSHNLNLVGSLLGGVDDNLTPTAGEVAGIGGNTEGTRGYTGFAGARMRYGLSRGQNAIELNGLGFSNSFRNVGVRPVYGGEATGRVSAALGGRTLVNIYERYRDDPLFSPGVAAPMSPLDSAVAAPELPPLVNPTTGYLVRRSQALDGNAAVQHRFTVRDTISIAGTHSVTRYEGGIGDGQTIGGSANYTRTVSRRSSITGTYNVALSDTDLPDGSARPLDTHTLTASYSMSHRMSRTRQLAFSVGGGTTRVATVSGLSAAPLTYMTPAGNLNLRVDLSQTWNLSTDYGRAVSVIEGVTLESFVSNNLTVRAGGGLGRRASLAFSTNMVLGQAGGTGSGTYDSFTTISQIQFSLNRYVNAMASHTFYAYRLDDAVILTPGVARELDRHAIRVGVTIRLPLFGSFSDETTTTTTPQGGGN